MTEDDTQLILSGMKVVNHYGTFYFSEPGNWIDSDGNPVVEKLHRTDGPAIEEPDGSKYWFINGQRHREDGPAIEDADGSKYWFINGQRHRTDGPAIEESDGTKQWFINGELHREDGPAVIEFDGTKSWFINGNEIQEPTIKKQFRFLIINPILILILGKIQR